MRRFACVLVLAAVLTAADKAPLPPIMRNAKTVFLFNRTGSLKLSDDLYAGIKKLKVWTIVDEQKDADLLFVIEVGDPVERGLYTVPVGNASIATPVIVQACTLLVYDPKSRDDNGDMKNVFAVSKNCRQGMKALVSEIQQRLPNVAK